MKDVLGRSVKLGDLVFYYTGKGNVGDGNYGLVLGEEVVFNPFYGIINCKHCYYVENPSPSQQQTRDKLKGLYTLYAQDNLVSKSASNKIGGIYVNNSQNIYYLYLGKYKVKQLTKDPNYVFEITNGDEGGYCYLRFNCGTTRAKNKLLRDFTLAIENGFTDNFESLFFNYLNIDGKVSVIKHNLYLHNSSPTKKLDLLIISKKEKKFETLIGELDEAGLKSIIGNGFTCQQHMPVNYNGDIIKKIKLEFIPLK